MNNTQQNTNNMKHQCFKKKKIKILTQFNLITPPPQPLPQLSDSDDEAIRQQSMNRDEQFFVNDFDMMMAKKKEEGGKFRRRKNNVDIINDNEEHIAIIVKRVRGVGG